ncbi:MAG: DNA primase [Desulfobacterales bacterium]|nr:DNA primase [Desulfobacterales bacterium]
MALFIPENKILEIKNTADIVSIISETVLLKKAGANYVGLCPFHSEKTPSFTVSPDKQIFHCFGCGAGGNIFSFLMKQNAISFAEAAGMLAKRYGIEIPHQGMSPGRKRRISERENLFDINQKALAFFQHVLVEDLRGKKALEYLTKRGIVNETIQRFNIGYAPEGWGNLKNYFQKKKVSLTLVEKSGLISPNKNQSGFYDRFRDRIIFPIIDVNMRVIGFGGRVMDNSQPKYLNSPETSIYNKSRSLYGLNLAKQTCRAHKSVYIVEGYFDLLALYQHGIQNVVATLGTALTSEHIHLLKGYADKMILVYDSDQAGIKAAQRCIDVFLKEHVNFKKEDVFKKENVDTRIMVLPAGHDPDSYIFEFGADVFISAAEKAPGIISFLMDTTIKKHGLSIEGKIHIIADMKEILASIDDSVARSLYIKELSERIQVDENVVLEKVREISVQGTGVTAKAKSLSFVSTKDLKNVNNLKIPREEDLQDRGSKLERQIIAMMLQFPEILFEISIRRVLNHFEDNLLKSIGKIILEYKEGLSEQSRAAISKSQLDDYVCGIINSIDDNEKRCIVTALAIKENPWDRSGCLKLIAQFEGGRNRLKDDLLNKIRAAEEDNDHELLIKLLQEKQKLAVLNEKQKPAQKERINF